LVEHHLERWLSAALSPSKGGLRSLQAVSKPSGSRQNITFSPKPPNVVSILGAEDAAKLNQRWARVLTEA
jgi:hypothetical protein